MGDVIAYIGPLAGEPGLNTLIERIEAGGLNIYVMECALGPFLALEHCRPPETPELLADAQAAAGELAAAFKASEHIRAVMEAEALSVGSYYRPV